MSERCKHGKLPENPCWECDEDRGETSSLAPATGSADEKTSALLKDSLGPKVRPLAYACHLPRITAKAREFGYALAVHGSLQRDLDLIAVPWSHDATDPEALVQAICETAGAFILDGQHPTLKPHGRIAYVLHMGAGLYMDLSVMPCIPPNDRPDAQPTP